MTSKKLLTLSGIVVVGLTLSGMAFAGDKYDDMYITNNTSMNQVVSTQWQSSEAADDFTRVGDVTVTISPDSTYDYQVYLGDDDVDHDDTVHGILVWSFSGINETVTTTYKGLYQRTVEGDHSPSWCHFEDSTINGTGGQEYISVTNQDGKTITSGTISPDSLDAMGMFISSTSSSLHSSGLSKLLNSIKL